MKMITVKNTETQQVLLDASKVPKSYKITPAQYYIDLSNDAQISVTSKLTQVSAAEKERIISLIFELSYAAKGFKDCEMQLAKYNRLMSCFSYQNHTVRDFKF